MHDPRRTPRLRGWGIAATLGLFVVNLVGFIDAQTGSAYGCGQDWPLCNGQVIPNFTGLHVLIEFGHRALVVVGIVLVMGFLVAMWRHHRDQAVVRLLMGVAVFFIVVQSILGGLAVLFVNPPEILALHLGFGLMAMNAVGLLTAWVFRTARPVPVPSEPVAPRSRLRAWFLWTYLFLVIYWGSYVSFREAGQACRGWPLCNGEWFPGFNGLTGIVFIHRLAAVALLGVVIWTGLAIRQERARPDLRRAAGILLSLTILQIVSGAYLVASHWTLNAYIVHVIGVMALFYVASYLAMLVDEEFWTGWTRRRAHARPIGGSQ